MPIVCLDAGHQNIGIDTGAHGNALKEEVITLDICTRTKKLLEYNGFTVIMTRTGATVLDGNFSTVADCLYARCAISNTANADLFMSVHVNSSRVAGEGTGAEVYHAPGSIRGKRLADIALYYMVQQCGWMNRGVKESGYIVLMKTDAPAILVENGFINNVNDAAKLTQSSCIQATARALAKAACDYFKISYADEPVIVNSVTVASPPVNTTLEPNVQAIIKLREAIAILEGGK